MKKILVIAALAVAALAGCNAQTGDRTLHNDTPNTTVTSSPATTQHTASPTGLTKNDVKLTLKTTQKECYGSAGCNVTVEVNVSDDLDKQGDDAYDVTFTVTGDSDGPTIDTVTLNADHSYTKPEEFLSTSSSKTKVSVAVDSVEKDGLDD